MRIEWVVTRRPTQMSSCAGLAKGCLMTKRVKVRHAVYPLRAVDRVCDVIDYLAEFPEGVTLSTLAPATHLPKSSAYRYLAALEMRGYVLRSDDGVGYRLAPSVLGPRGTAADRLERLLLAAKPLMVRLAPTGDHGACLLGTLDPPGIRYLWVTSAPTPDVRIPKAGDREMLHTTAVGKAIGAQLSDDTVLAMLAVSGLPAPTPQTLQSPSAYLRELHRIRGEGFAVSTHERYPDMRAVAVPVGGETLAIGVAGRGDALPPDRIAGTVRQLRRASIVLAREMRQ